MTGPLRFDPREVAGADTDATDAELAEAMLAARALEAATPVAGSAAAPELADRIMTAVRREPAPRALGIVATLRRRPSPRGVLDSLALAWRRVLTGGPIGVRATAFAYVAAVVILAASISGVAAYGAAGALGVLPRESHRPDASLPLRTPEALESPDATTEETNEPGDSTEPADSAEPSDDAGQSNAPRASDDHGGASGGGDGSGDGGGDGSPTASPSSGDDHGGGSTAEPTGTPRPTQTPEPSRTPQPTSSSSDGSGSSSGSGSSTAGGGEPSPTSGSGG